MIFKTANWWYPQGSSNIEHGVIFSKKYCLSNQLLHTLAQTLEEEDSNISISLSSNSSQFWKDVKSNLSITFSLVLCLGAGGVCLYVLLYIPTSNIIHEIAGQRLNSASCKITKVVEDFRYRIKVIPNNTQILPFNMTAKSINDEKFNTGQSVNCFWDRFCLKPIFSPKCWVQIQFQSEIKDLNTETILLSFIPLLGISALSLCILCKCTSRGN